MQQLLVFLCGHFSFSEIKNCMKISKLWRNIHLCLYQLLQVLLVVFYYNCKAMMCSFQLQENQDEIENMMNAIFKGVFVHRYR